MSALPLRAHPGFRVVRMIGVLAGLSAILSFLGAGLVLLARISLRMGQLLERLDGHIRVSDARDAETVACHLGRVHDIDRFDVCAGTASMRSPGWRSPV